MADVFKVPGSSYEELVKIIKAYSNGKTGVALSLDDLAQLTGMDKTVVSRNNGFLILIELISEGSKKAPTDLGINLGRAYSLNMNEEIERIWTIIIENNEFLSRMIAAIKIRNGMEKVSLLNHILYSAGVTPNNPAKTGANTIIEIFKVAGLVAETDGKIIACVKESQTTNCLDEVSKKSESTIPPIITLPQPVMSNNKYQVSININIEVKSEELNDLSEKLKQLLKSISE